MPTTPRPLREDSASQARRAAFRALHGPRLHGFALLMTLGDAPRAAELAADALDAGLRHVDELRHPERAASWLRARVVRAARRLPPPAGRPSQRLHLLDRLGADAAVAAGLTALRPAERGALISSAIERLDRRDVGTVVGRHGAALERLLAGARRRFTAAHRAAASAEAPAAGPLVERIRDIAARAIS